MQKPNDYARTPKQEQERVRNAIVALHHAIFLVPLCAPLATNQ